MRNSQAELLVIRAQDCARADLFLSAVIKNEQALPQLRVQAAGLLLPFQCARVTDRKISKPIDLPVATDVAGARGNIGIIKAYVAAGQLGLEEGQALIEMELKTIDAIMATALEVDVQALERHTIENPKTVGGVHVKGGMPQLPGTDTILPEADPEPQRGPWKR
jgi:hypothetical protein